jgi:SAM-dependent methyltransferase
VEPIWEIRSLPFLYRPLCTPHNPAGVPDALPFHLGVDTATGRLMQLPVPHLDEILSTAYSDGSMITGMMDEEGIGRQYAEDFLSIVTQGSGRERLDGLRIIEIGSGTGYLLHRLHNLGAEVRGVEPGPQAEVGAALYDIRIDRAFFPGVDVGADYDLAILYLVLEHVADPEELLREVSRIVRPGGTVLVAVQDEEPYIRSGELSLLFHEHYSYFTTSSLRRTIRAAGGSRVAVRNSSFSNLIVATYSPGETGGGWDDPAPDLDLASAFRPRAERVVARVWAKLDTVHAAGGTVGLFVPSRAVNILAMRDGPPLGVRFFDDDRALQGTYYPGYPMPVEARDNLMERPPSCVLVMSLSFGRKIVESIRADLPASVEVVPLSSLLSG